MAFKWYEWIGLLIIILGFYLIGNNTLSIALGLILIEVGNILILVGWNIERKKKNYKNKIIYAFVWILFIFVTLSLLINLLLMMIPVE